MQTRRKMKGRARRALLSIALGIVPTLCATTIPGQAAGTRQAPERPCIFDHVSLRTTPGECQPRALSYPKSVKGVVRRAIYDSALVYGIPYRILLRIARCESGLNPGATDGMHFGLYQFLPDTFSRGAAEMQSMTGITAGSYWRPLDSAYVAGFLFAVGQSPRWECQ
jgi:hypothetical protein